jgi:hypothetical protein
MKVYLVYEYDPLKIQVGVIGVYADKINAMKVDKKSMLMPCMVTCRQVREMIISDLATIPKSGHSDFIET